MDMFRKCVDDVVDRTIIFTDGFMDHDKENLRWRVNFVYKEFCDNDLKVQVSTKNGNKD
jgi:hypothetical protein